MDEMSVKCTEAWKKYYELADAARMLEDALKTETRREEVKRLAKAFEEAMKVRDDALTKAHAIRYDELVAAGLVVEEEDDVFDNHDPDAWLK